jgi:Zn-dependent protease with chaperone function
LLYRKAARGINESLSNKFTSTFARDTGLPMNRIQLAVVESNGMQAYSFSPFPFRRCHFIILSNGMTTLLSEKELIAVIAHEYAHLYLQDSYWLPLARITLPRVLRSLRSSLIRRMELRADSVSVQWTRRPGHLASALLRITEAEGASGNHHTGASTSSQVSLSTRHSQLLVERIERLLDLDMESLPRSWPIW